MKHSCDCEPMFPGHLSFERSQKAQVICVCVGEREVGVISQKSNKFIQR